MSPLKKGILLFLPPFSREAGPLRSSFSEASASATGGFSSLKKNSSLSWSSVFIIILDMLAMFFIGWISFGYFNQGLMPHESVESLKQIFPVFINKPISFEEQQDSPPRESCSHSKCLDGYQNLVKSKTLNSNPVEASVIAQTLKIDELLSTRYQQKAKVWKQETKDEDGYLKTHYLFYEERVGYFSGTLVEKKDQPGPKPLVLALHGHFENGDYFYKNRFGRSLIDLGVAAFYLDFRAMDLNEKEAITMKQLIHAGYTLMGLRIYEATLVLDYFLNKPDFNNVFTLGHSSGGEISVYLGLLDDRVDHVITDNPPYSFNRIANSNSFHDEFIPDYFRILPNRIKPLMDKLELLKVEYGYKDKGQVLEWIRERID